MGVTLIRSPLAIFDRLEGAICIPSYFPLGLRIWYPDARRVLCAMCEGHFLLQTIAAGCRPGGIPKIFANYLGHFSLNASSVANDPGFI